MVSYDSKLRTGTSFPFSHGEEEGIRGIDVIFPKDCLDKGTASRNRRVFFAILEGLRRLTYRNGYVIV